MYTAINNSYPNILRVATEVGTDTGMLYVPPSIEMIEAFPGVGNVATRKKFRDGVLIRGFELHNRSGGAATVGLGFRFGPSHWMVGRLSEDGATYTDLTETAQAKGAITLGVAGADQTGFVVVADRPIGWISLLITTAETNAGGGTVVDHVSYYSDAGNTWTAVSSAASTDDFTAANTVLSAAIKNFVWQPVANMSGITNVTGIPSGWYGIRVTAAEREAGDVAPIATGIECGNLLCCAALANNGIYANERMEYKEWAADGIVAYFSTANALNRVYCECRPLG